MLFRVPICITEREEQGQRGRWQVTRSTCQVQRTQCPSPPRPYTCQGTVNQHATGSGHPTRLIASWRGHRPGKSPVLLSCLQAPGESPEVMTNNDAQEVSFPLMISFGWCWSMPKYLLGFRSLNPLFQRQNW